MNKFENPEMEKIKVTFKFNNIIEFIKIPFEYFVIDSIPILIENLENHLLGILFKIFIIILNLIIALIFTLIFIPFSILTIISFEIIEVD